ncbi:MAG: glycine cleavage system aminomethyltransferase GcvT, partial [Candidatus Omnitrophica bacterium]|nr:glycine cleavage system aminomethyltransferase GcvT [Candidatus Omnitrophota bacterium]
MTQSKRLPLHDLHLKLGAKIGAFGEWEVPLYYSTVIEEHNAVRRGVGIFDISHMGEIFVEGPKARHFLNYLVTNQIEKLKPGRALYSPVCNKQGGIVDDVIVYELDSEHYLVIVNASNIDKDYQWFSSHSIAGARITNRSDEYGLLAVQGPDSVAVICKIFSEEIEKLSYYSIMQTSSPWKNTFLARTGYTG